MAFIAKLINIERADQTLNVEVEYRDEASGWNTKRVFNFQNGDTITLAEIRNQVITTGQVYKAAIAKENTLKANIGTEITI